MLMLSAAAADWELNGHDICLQIRRMWALRRLTVLAGLNSPWCSNLTIFRVFVLLVDVTDSFFRDLQCHHHIHWQFVISLRFLTHVTAEQLDGLTWLNGFDRIDLC